MKLASVLSKALPAGKFWTDAWSLVEGCTPVSPGCAHCWLEGIYGRNLPNRPKDVVDPHSGCWTGKVVCREDRLVLPYKSKKPRVYAIWSDFFHGSVPDWFREKAFAVMALSVQHHFIIVTKRAEKAAKFLSRLDKDCVADQVGQLPFLLTDPDSAHSFVTFKMDTPLPNVTVLVTMEDQLRADERTPYAIEMAAAGWRVGVLCEPLLGPVQIRQDWGHLGANGPLDAFSWLIAGGESGLSSRSTHPAWLRSLRDQAQAASVPFFFKSWGRMMPAEQTSSGTHGKKRRNIYHGLSYENTASYPTSKNRLDGREWLEVPE